MNSSQTSHPSIDVPGTVGQMIRQHPLTFYFLFAYAISWILEIPYLLSGWGILAGNFTIAFVLKGFGPSLSAIIVTSVLEGKEGRLRLRNRITQWRAGWKWYLFSLVGIPVLVMLGIIVQPGMLASFEGVQALLLVTYPVTFVVVFLGGGPLGEEIGWRGFALPRMQPRFGPLRGTLLLGVLWTFWHLPDFLDSAAQGGGPGTSFSNFLTNFSTFFLMVLALAIIMTWVFNHTAGSLLIALLLHASVNTPQLTLVPLFTAVDISRLDLAGLAGFGVTALLIVFLTRGRLGYDSSKEPA